MEAALRTVKRAAPPLVAFSFRGANVAVLFGEDGASVECPICRTRCLIPGTHELVVNFRVHKAMTIYPSVSCPNTAQCGFRVVVVRGVAFEVERNGTPDTAESEAPLKQGQRRCRECRRAFNPGLHAGGKTTTGRWGRGRWSEDDDAPPSVCHQCRSRDNWLPSAPMAKRRRKGKVAKGEKW